MLEVLVVYTMKMEKLFVLIKKIEKREYTMFDMMKEIGTLQIVELLEKK